ncbi:MAG: site-2 protease family protein [Candidatus Obscuribacterales bacterium]|nr:site-2 protease family protein [Candidatus Obscuribacterales bacterium]
MIGVLLILLILFLMIVGHELAHFLVARLFGFQTPVFGMGLPFGPHWTIGRGGNTQLRIHPLLIGAYSVIPELDPEPTSEDGSPSPLPKPFSKFSLWKRLTVVIAGIAFYVLFAWLALLVSFNVSGIAKTQVVVQALSSTNPVATNAGVKAGDTIISIDSQQVSTPDDFTSYLRSHPAAAVTVHIQRQAQPLDIAMTPNADGKVGMSLIATTSGYQSVAPSDCLGLATEKLCSLTTGMFEGMGAMLGSVSQPQPGGTETRVHGIVAIIKIGADIINQDWRQLPLFVAMFSIGMAIVNLMPWPGFDGSHFLAILINAVRGRPLNQTGLLRWLFIAAVVLTLFTGGTPLCFLRGQQRKSPGKD